MLQCLAYYDTKFNVSIQHLEFVLPVSETIVAIAIISIEQELADNESQLYVGNLCVSMQLLCKLPLCNILDGIVRELEYYAVDTTLKGCVRVGF